MWEGPDYLTKGWPCDKPLVKSSSVPVASISILRRFRTFPWLRMSLCFSSCHFGLTSTKCNANIVRKADGVSIYLDLDHAIMLSVSDSHWGCSLRYFTFVICFDSLRYWHCWGHPVEFGVCCLSYVLCHLGLSTEENRLTSTNFYGLARSSQFSQGTFSKSMRRYMMQLLLYGVKVATMEALNRIAEGSIWEWSIIINGNGPVGRILTF